MRKNILLLLVLFLTALNLPTAKPGAPSSASDTVAKNVARAQVFKVLGAAATFYGYVFLPELAILVHRQVIYSAYSCDLYG